MENHTLTPVWARRTPTEPESLAELRGDCAQLVARWKTAAPVASTAPPGAPALPRGVTVSLVSASLLDGISEYGD